MNNPQFRPPAEAGSVILQTDVGCPHNACTFCGMYKHVRFRRRPWNEVEAILRDEAAHSPDAERVFLADGDVMARPAEELRAILDAAAASFPRLSRVSLYANGSSIAGKTDAELRDLRERRLHTLYLGLESGDDAVLERCHKGETADGMVLAAQRAQAAGLRVSVMVLLGLAGRAGSARHARLTAEALNRMQPRLLSTLRVIPVPGTPLAREAEAGRFEMLTEAEVVGELRALLAALDLRATVFRADHTSNVLALQARLPAQRDALLAQLDALLRSGRLDAHSPGALPRWL
jgi:radical SAM superfamily enzyme YgiQ (UPF0313 family)